jgi:hypothetical protein
MQFKNAPWTEDLPPKPELLECRYQLAEILHASGMGLYLEQILHDLDDMKGASGNMTVNLFFNIFENPLMGSGYLYSRILLKLSVKGTTSPAETWKPAIEVFHGYILL